MKLKNGIPSVSTLSRILSRLDEEYFLYVFMMWISEIVSSKGKHIAIDGKALCGSTDKVGQKKTPLLLNAVETSTGLVLSQLPIPDKSCEITYLPRIIELLDLKDSLITIDAIGTQTRIMEKILSLGGHFLLMVKMNQVNSYDEIKIFFNGLREEKAKDNLYTIKRSYEKNRERHEYRCCESYGKADCLSRKATDWSFIQSVGCITSTRILEMKDSTGNDITPDRESFLKNGSTRQPHPIAGDNEKDEIQIVGLISDQILTAEQMSVYKREHWCIENKLHHVLDDTFREDRSPARKSRNNLALIRKFAYNLLRMIMNDQSSSDTITVIMDTLSDDLELLEKYIFKGAASLY